MRASDTLLNILSSNRIISILDIGIGYGTLAYNVRNLFEPFKFIREKWKYIVDGIDIQPNYITPLHKYLYNNIIIGDVRTIDFQSYDLIVASHVVEHLPKEDAIKLITKLKTKCNFLIVSCPHGFLKQGNKNDNPFETHQSEWYIEDFKGCLINVNGNEIIAYWKRN